MIITSHQDIYFFR